ncbi:MAG: hypothetical protein WKF94_14275 [Solirubrobacteraceae bacterium]
MSALPVGAPRGPRELSLFVVDRDRLHPRAMDEEIEFATGDLTESGLEDDRRLDEGDRREQSFGRFGDQANELGPLGLVEENGYQR